MPRPTIIAFLDHGTVARTIDTGVEEAVATMAALKAAGIDFGAVTDQLEEEGIAAFNKSFESLLSGVASKRAQLSATPAD
jgi:transaldolase